MRRRFGAVTVTAVSATLDAWAANADRGARTVDPWPSGGRYVEPAWYKPSEDVFVNGWLEGDGARLSGMSINILLDGEYRTTLKTDAKGEFFGNVGTIPEGIHTVDGVFYAWGGYTEARDSVVIEVKKIPVYLDVWTETTENKAKTSFRGIEEVQFNCVLTAIAPADGGKRLSGMTINILVDDAFITTVTTNASGMAEANLGRLGIGTHAVKGIFYPWEDYAGAEDVENPVTVTPYPRLMELLPGWFDLDRRIRNRPIWQTYAQLRWGGVSLEKYKGEKLYVLV